MVSNELGPKKTPDLERFKSTKIKNPNSLTFVRRNKLTHSNWPTKKSDRLKDELS